MAATKKRQRKRQVYVCQQCGSPFSWAHTNKEYKPHPAVKTKASGNPILFVTPSMPTPKPVRRVGQDDPDVQIFIERKCLSCGDKHRQDVNSSNVINDTYEQLLNAHFVEMKSPFETELKFRSIKVDKKTMQKAARMEAISKHGMPAFFAFCEDRAGLLYRFSGTSAMKIIYGAVKDKWFSTRICIQKFVRTNKNLKGWHMHSAIGNEEAIQHWRQSPKIVGEITLL